MTWREPCAALDDDTGPWTKPGILSVIWEIICGILAAIRSLFS